MRALAGYRVSWLRSDLVAGVVLTTLLVPQGMAYAELAGLPPITGLYTSILCLVGYALCGPSRILVLGPDSSLGPMIAASLLPILGANGSPERAIALASMLALMVGAIMIAASVARLGFVADLLSKPTQIGYMNGLALTILIGQLPKLFGFSVERRRPDRRGPGLRERGGRRQDGGRRRGGRRPQPASSSSRLGDGRRRCRACSWRSCWRSAHRRSSTSPTTGCRWSGRCPRGSLRSPFPNAFSDIPLLVAGALGISLVALTDTISTASAFAARTGQEVNGDGEMLGIGVANVAAGLFQGFPVSTSGSRTAVAERAGAKTQVTGLVGAAAIVLMLLLVPGLLRNLPNPTLAAVVIAASLSLADIPATVRLWRQGRVEFLLSGVAFLGVALLGVLWGIAVAVALSILNVFRRAWWPHHTTLGRVAGIPGQHDVELHPNAEQLPGLVIFRFDAPLFFANARTFRDEIRRLAAATPRPRWILIAAESDHRRRHHRRRHARRARRGAQRRRDLAGVRRAQGSGPRQARALRADRAAGPRPFLPDDRRSHRRVPPAERRRMGAARRDGPLDVHHPDRGTNCASATGETAAKWAAHSSSLSSPR